MDIKNLLFIVLLIILCVPFIISQEVQDEHEFSYDVNSPNGPNHWGMINPNWTKCNEGDMQSPIDLTHPRVVITRLERLDRDYRPANATLVNRGHDIMLKLIGGGGYILINGIRYNLELHLVHESINKKIAVVGILYQIGLPDPFLKMLEPYFIALANSTSQVEVSTGIVDPRQINIGSEAYYRYLGSLTTPPCFENVTWTVVQKVRMVSQEQVHLIRQAIHDKTIGNARPIQPLNNRVVKLYKPDHL